MEYEGEFYQTDGEHEFKRHPDGSWMLTVFPEAVRLVLKPQPVEHPEGEPIDGAYCC